MTEDKNEKKSNDFAVLKNIIKKTGLTEECKKYLSTREKNRVFSEQLRQILADKKMTQADACRLLEIPRRTFQNWFLGYNKPPAYMQEIVIEKLKKVEKPSL